MKVVRSGCVAVLALALAVARADSTAAPVRDGSELLPSWSGSIPVAAGPETSAAGKVQAFGGPELVSSWSGTIPVSSPAMSPSGTEVAGGPELLSSWNGYIPTAGEQEERLVPEQIRMIQRSLSEKGYAVQLSGAWDESTRTAVKSFQRTNHIVETGRLDSATQDALGIHSEEAVPVSGQSAPERSK